MSTPTRKRIFIDLTGDSHSDNSDNDGTRESTEPLAKIRKTSHSCQQGSISPAPPPSGIPGFDECSPSWAPPPSVLPSFEERSPSWAPPQSLHSGEDLEYDPEPDPDVSLLSDYQHKIYQMTNQVHDLEDNQQRLIDDKASLERRLGELEAALDQARVDKHAVEEEADEIYFRLPENAGTTPIDRIRAQWRSLDALIAKTVDSYLIDSALVFPSEYHLLANLTRLPGGLLCAEKTGSLLFQAWIWKFLHERIFTRYSTFWAGQMGADETRRLDEERGMHTPLSIPSMHVHHANTSGAAKIGKTSAMRTHDMDRTDQVNNILTQVPSNKCEQIHTLALEIFDFFFHDLASSADNISIEDLIRDLKDVLRRATDLDVVLRRSRSNFEVGLPSAGVSGTRLFDLESMKITRYRDAGEEVVLVVAPALHQRGVFFNEEKMTDEADRVVIKSKVVVGRGEGERDIVVDAEETEEPDIKRDIKEWVMKQEEPEGEVKTEGALGEESTCVAESGRGGWSDWAYRRPSSINS
jgi:hypothetical protein